jgi:hypothetical protein
MDYKGLKNIFILYSIVSFIAKYTNGIKDIPILNIPLNEGTDNVVYSLYVFIFMLSLTHLIVERKNYKLIFEIFLLTLIFIPVTVAKFWQDINPYLVEISISLLFSFLVSYFSHISLEGLSFIRSKKESKQLRLPRIPVAVRSKLIFNSLLTGVFIFLFVFFSQKYLNYFFITQKILFLTITSFFVFLIIFLREEIYLKLKIFNWEEIRNRKREEKEINDSHDRDYQQLGLIKTDLSSSKSQEVYSYIKSQDVNAIDNYYLKGNDPNEIFAFGFTALIHACAEGKTNSVNKLIEHGADLNIKNSKGRTALGFAARYNYYEIVKILLEKGANPNECSLGTETPLQIASIFGNEETIKLLLEVEGIDIKRKTLVTNKTALELAMDNGHGNIAKIIRNKIQTL